MITGPLSLSSSSSSLSLSLPEDMLMKAIQILDYGSIEDQIIMNPKVPIPLGNSDNDGISFPIAPQMDSMPTTTKQKQNLRKSWLLIRTLAVALAPGDCRVLSGKTRKFQGPKSFPYIPGGDVCGIVIDSMENEIFEKGDVVVARFFRKPMGALGEYAVIESTVCDRIPLLLTPPQNEHQQEEQQQEEQKQEELEEEEKQEKKRRNDAILGAAAMGSSGTAALCFAEAIHKKPTKRILILGAGGGVGSHLCQLARYTFQPTESTTNENQKNETTAKAVPANVYIAGVSQNPTRLLQHPIHCDDAIDYTKEDPWTKQEWIDDPFDVIVDLACGGWLRILADRKTSSSSSSILKCASEGGRYITTNPDNAIFEIKSWSGLIQEFILTSLWRAIYTRYNPYYRWSLPKYTMAMGLPDDKMIMKRTMKLVEDGLLVPVLDFDEMDGPYPFTQDGVKKAFLRQQSRHAKGKVVIQVAEL